MKCFTYIRSADDTLSFIQRIYHDFHLIFNNMSERWHVRRTVITGKNDHAL